MRNLIYLLSGVTLILGFIIGTTISNVCAQSNFPMCVTIYKYLVWPNFQSGVIPVASNNSGYLTSSPMYVSNNNDVVVRTGITANNYVSSPYLVTKKLNAVDEIYTGGLIRGGAFQFMPRDSAPTNPQEGMMYYDSGMGTFKCYKKIQDNPLRYDWVDCGGVTAGFPFNLELITIHGIVSWYPNIAYTQGWGTGCIYDQGEWKCDRVVAGAGGGVWRSTQTSTFTAGNTTLTISGGHSGPISGVYITVTTYCPTGYIRTGCSVYNYTAPSEYGVYDTSPNGCSSPVEGNEELITAYCLKIK
jgi:hypothetical protein